MTDQKAPRLNHPDAPRLHPLPIRIMHWVNAAAIILMITSGLGIYNDEVILGAFTFPSWITPGTWAPHYLQWHFFGMWVLVLNGIAYLSYGLATGRLRRKLLPVRISELIAVIRDTLRLRLAHEDITTYNAVQKLLYIGVILAVIVQVMSGLAIWKPVQFSGLLSLFVDFQGARIAHFFGMAAIATFLVIHVTLAFLVPRTIVAMVTGGPEVGQPEPKETPSVASKAGA